MNQSKKSTAGRIASYDTVKTLLGRCGSMVVAIVLTVLLMVLLAWATFVENKYGAGVSQFAIYRAWWFDVLLVLFGGNVLCAMLARLVAGRNAPFLWQRGHIPFVIAHLGVLILLIGCWVTSRFGLEAQLTVYEGELGRLAQRMSGDEINLEIIDFRKQGHDETVEGQSEQERLARELLESLRDKTKTKPPELELQPMLDVLALNRRERIPVTLGPLSWREYDRTSATAAHETSAVSWPMRQLLRTARRSDGTVYDKDGIRVELLDYLADSRLKPAEQLQLRVQRIEPEDGASKETLDWETRDLPLGLATDDRRSDPYVTTLPEERITYRLAKSNAETTAFLEMDKEQPTGTWGGIVMQIGGARHVIAVDDLIKRQAQFGNRVNRAMRAKEDAEFAMTALRVRLLATDDATDAETLKTQLTDKEAEIEQRDKELAELNAQMRMVIGETGLSVEMPRIVPEYLQMILVVYRDDDTRYVLALNGDQPLMATVPDALGMQVMYLFDPEMILKEQPGQTPSTPLERAMKPRLDLLQGRDHSIVTGVPELYYRFWDGRKYTQSGVMPVDQTVLSLEGHDGSTLKAAVGKYEAQDYPGLKLVAEPFKSLSESKAGRLATVPCIKLRVRVDGVGDETYWVHKTPFLFPPGEMREHQIGYVSGQNRTVAVTFPAAWLDLGFSLFLHKFERKLEPGIGMPSHFSSLVSVYPIDDTKADTTDREPLHDQVLIRMNQPGMFADQVTGRKYRVFQSSYQGPYHPGMQVYEMRHGGQLIEDETQPRESLYASTLTANYDPGRGLKYLGSLLLVLGTLAFIYRKKASGIGLQASGSNRSLTLPAVVGLALFVAVNGSGTHVFAQYDNSPLTTRRQPLATTLDWRAWEKLPVFFDGRVMPLATYARITVTAVCGRSLPTFELDENVIAEAKRDALLDEQQIARLREKFADGKRQFGNEELIFSWLVEPEVWEYVPFLAANDKDLRDELKTTRKGEFIAPWQVKKNAMNLQRAIDRWQKVQANQLDDGAIGKLSNDGLAALRSLGPKAMKLHDSYSAYRALTNEANALPVYELGMKISQAEWQSRSAYRMQLALERVPIDLSQLCGSVPFGRGELAVLNQDLGDLAAVIQRARYHEAGDTVTPRTLEDELERLLVECDRLLPEAERFRDAMFALNTNAIPRNAGANPERLRMVRNQAEQLRYALLQTRQWCESAYLSLYDNGGSSSRSYALQIFPALVAESIKIDRSYPVQSNMPGREYAESSRMPTWLTLHTLLFGSDDMMRRFALPGLMLESVESDEWRVASEEERATLAPGLGLSWIGARMLFNDMATAYINLENRKIAATDRAEQINKFNLAAIFFAANLRSSAEATSKLRLDLVPPELRDNDLLAKTGYPSKSLIRAEYDYERLQPFYWMWVTSAASLVLLLASAIASLFDRKRRIVEASLFWGGFAMLLVSQGITLTGGCYRAYISGWAPVTNMFETIVLMAFCVAVIGIWYTFQPLFGERLLRAWRMAALPKGRTNVDGTGDNRRLALLQLILLPVRVILAIVTLYYILLVSYGEAGGGELSWDVVREGIAIKDPIDFTVVVISIALLVWLVPRVVLTILIFPFVGKKHPSLATIQPTNSQQPKFCTPHFALCAPLDRKLFLIVGATLALLSGLAAYFGDSMFSPNIRPLMAVLRSNFWLTVHVFAIIIGYASGAIAWLLAAIACGMCIFGRWHTKRNSDGTYTAQIPDRTEALMPYIMSMLRWTVLLVAVGTILGARWADYSWGRFWGWDPKEVWALVTLLYYVIVLHGRVARYYGNFGIMLGAQFGSIAIIMTWYGANVIFKSGRHAYGGADTSVETFVLFVFIAVNLIWGFFAILRLIVQKTIADSLSYINHKGDKH